MPGTTSISKYFMYIISILVALSGCIPINSGDKHSPIHEIVSTANQTFYLDQRIWYQDVHAEIQGDKIILKGEAFFTSPVHGIARKIHKAGYEHEVLDSISYLPEHFGDDLAYGIITDTYVMGRYKPVSEKQEGTEMLYGEPVRLIKDTGEYLQVQSAIAYLGFIPKTALRTVNLDEWNRYQAGKQAIFTRNVKLENGLDLKMGVRLPYLGDGCLLLADGSSHELSQDNYRIIDPAANPLREAIISAAEQYLGLPYVWGGRSADGVDCSGFVMQSYALNGLYLPRDSDEIANVGRIIGLPGWTDAMLPGDILFFMGSRRMITHTAIYLGDGRVIHSLGEGVQIQSMNPADPEYAEGLARRFIFAKRIFD
ncbi:C40 family peptidase [bacterium]|nr:C40 family peptidase [bacterium]